MKEHSLDALGITAGKATALLGGASTVISGLTANDYTTGVGMIGMFAGLLMQWFFNHKRDRREREEFRLRRELLQRELEEGRYEQYVSEMEGGECKDG